MPLSSRNPPVNKKILIDIIGILLIALVVVVGYKLSPILLPKADVSVTPEPACDLHRTACGASLPGGGRLQLAITPRPIPMVKPLRVEVRLEGVDASHVEIDFAGVDMNMGLNRQVLSKQADGSFAGEATLPVCVTGWMDWQATVIAETAGQRVAVPFRFASAPRGEH